MTQPHERRNLEIKAACHNPAAARLAAVRLTGRQPTLLRQVDTYFDVPRGRLKLREIDASAAELIYYERPDDPAARVSRYHRLPLPDPAAMTALLAAAFGVRAVVRKRRELWLYDNVRIHLDAVENLGNFLELEAVIGGNMKDADSLRRLEHLTQALAIRPEHHIAGSYGELVGQGPTETPP